MQAYTPKLQITKVLALTLAIVGVLCAVYAVHVSRVHAGFPYFSTSVNVTSPKPPEVRKYDPGQNMQFSGQFSWAYCGNAGNFRVYGRMSRPVPVAQGHAPLGAWTEVSSGTGRKTYTDTFTAPTRPGVYKFQYELEFGSPCVGIRGANCSGHTLMSELQRKSPQLQARGVRLISAPVYTYRRSGTVTFEVRDPSPPQANCPANQIPAMQNGVRVCVPQTLTVSCTSSATTARIGETVSFAADSSAPATFTWYEGAGIDGRVIGGPETGTRSILSRTFTQPGQYQVTAYAQNASGVGMCTRGVFVTDDDEEDVGQEQVVDEFGNVITDAAIVTPNGTTITLNPTAGNASIVFALDPTLTNTTCGATWVAQNAGACYIVQYGNRATATEVGTTGSQQVLPATYRIECIATRDGRIVSSEEKICRQNLNVREI